MNNKDTIPNLKEAHYKDDFLKDKGTENMKTKTKVMKVKMVTKAQDNEKCRELFRKDEVGATKTKAHQNPDMKTKRAMKAKGL